MPSKMRRAVGYMSALLSVINSKPIFRLSFKVDRPLLFHIYTSFFLS